MANAYQPLKGKSRYIYPRVEQVAPDALVYVQGSSKTKVKIIEDDGTVHEQEVDFMNFISSISVTKGIDSVPGSASFNLTAPLHLSLQIANPLAKSFSTLQEVEIYMKGRFLVGPDQEASYYPVFWGLITSVNEGFDNGAHTIAITCQDMMRWMQVTKVALQSAAAGNPGNLSNPGGVPDSSIQVNPNAKGRVPTAGSDKISQQAGQLSTVTSGFNTVYVGISIPGIINDLVRNATGDNFLQVQDIPNGAQDQAVNIISQNQVFSTALSNIVGVNRSIISIWTERFKSFGGALNIFGFKRTIPKQGVARQVLDVEVDPAAYDEIYGSDIVNIEALFPFGTVINEGSVGSPPPFETMFGNRLDVAKEAASKLLHFEFFQDMDGSIIFKPPFYNLDVRQNPFHVIDDIDIISMNLVEDETQLITRLDVKGTFATGKEGASNQGTYGFAIDYDKFAKYGMRTEEMSVNFITDNEKMTTFATQELSRRNSLALNGHVRIQGRPELKLGYPIYIISQDAFYYLTGISHSFAFGGSFETDLQFTAGRVRRYDPNGLPLKHLAVFVDPSSIKQIDNPGKIDSLDDANPVVDSFDTCSLASFDDERPNYRDKTFDQILRQQGTFRFIRDHKVTDPTHIAHNITDNEAYVLVGSPFKYGRDLMLNEQFELTERIETSTTDKAADTALRMTIRKGSFPGFQRRLTLEDLSSSTNPFTNDANKTDAAKSATFMKPSSSGIFDGQSGNAATMTGLA